MTDDAYTASWDSSCSEQRGVPPAADADCRLDMPQPAAVHLMNDFHSPRTDTQLRDGPSC